MAVVGTGEGGGVEGGGGAAAAGERAPGEVERAARVGALSGRRVALGAGHGAAQRAGRQVGLVGAHPAGGGGGAARGVLRRGGGKLGIEGGGDPGRVAVAAGAAGDAHVDPAVQVAGQVDGGGRVAGVAGRNSRRSGCAERRVARHGRCRRWWGRGSSRSERRRCSLRRRIRGSRRWSRWTRSRRGSRRPSSRAFRRRGRPSRWRGPRSSGRRGTRRTRRPGRWRRPSGGVDGPRRHASWRRSRPCSLLGVRRAAGGWRRSPGASRHHGRACKLCWDRDPVRRRRPTPPVADRRRRKAKRRKMPGPGSEMKWAYGESDGPDIFPSRGRQDLHRRICRPREQDNAPCARDRPSIDPEGLNESLSFAFAAPGGGARPRAAGPESVAADTHSECRGPSWTRRGELHRLNRFLRGARLGYDAFRRARLPRAGRHPRRSRS